MPSNAYVSVDEVKDYLCLTDNDRDYALDLTVEAASRMIDRWTGHQFYVSTASVRYFTWPLSGDPMYLKIDDTLSLTELATDTNGDGVYETLWTPSTDYVLGPLNAPSKLQPYTRLERRSWSGRFFFPAYTNAVRLTGTFGYALAVPKPIKQLALMVTEVMARPLMDMSLPGVQRFSQGSGGISFEMTPEDLPPMGHAILAMYGEQTYVVV